MKVYCRLSPLDHQRIGRPKDSAKRAAILDAATNLFTRQPYDMVKMEDVAALAGVSKMTVYSNFRDKESLFETIIGTISDGMIETLDGPDPGPGDIGDRLVAVGSTFLRLMLGPRIAGLCHSLPGALRSNRALGPRFYNAGPGRGRAALAAMIAVAPDLEIDDAAQAADDLMSLWESGLCAKIAFGVAEALSEEEIQRRVRRGTDIFLKAYGLK